MNAIIFPIQRFGVALVRDGQLKLNQPKFKFDLRPIEDGCDCSTCKHYTRSYLNHVVRNEAVGASLLTIHNVAYQVHFGIFIFPIKIQFLFFHFISP